MNVKQRIAYFNILQMFKCIHGNAPNYLCNQIIMACEISERNTRFTDFNNVYVPFPRKAVFKGSFIYTASILWNSMPNILKECNVLSSFKILLRNYIFTSF